MYWLKTCVEFPLNDIQNILTSKKHFIFISKIGLKALLIPSKPRKTKKGKNIICFGATFFQKKSRQFVFETLIQYLLPLYVNWSFFDIVNLSTLRYEQVLELLSCVRKYFKELYYLKLFLRIFFFNCSYW